MTEVALVALRDTGAKGSLYESYDVSAVGEVMFVYSDQTITTYNESKTRVLNFQRGVPSRGACPLARLPALADGGVRPVGCLQSRSAAALQIKAKRKEVELNLHGEKRGVYGDGAACEPGRARVLDSVELKSVRLSPHQRHTSPPSPWPALLRVEETAHFLFQAGKRDCAVSHSVRQTSTDNCGRNRFQAEAKIFMTAKTGIQNLSAIQLAPLKLLLLQQNSLWCICQRGEIIFLKLGKETSRKDKFRLERFGHRSTTIHGNKTRSADVILRHLTMANSLVILSRGIPETMASFGVKQFLSDAGCKLVFYAHNVGKGVSIDSTCLLTLFQAISISPRRSVWAELKVKALRYISSSTVFCWVLQMLLNIRLPIILTNNNSKRNITKTIDFQYCSAGPHDRDPGSVFAVLRLSHDVLCLALMIWASGSMVFILFRHKQRVHHLHRHSSCRSSPETRASQSILILVRARRAVIYASYSESCCDGFTRKTINGDSLLRNAGSARPVCLDEDIKFSHRCCIQMCKLNTCGQAWGQ
ncbi:uncharacterized protein LOC104857206 [Fukomys damarensis]|uniref:uncharacterized protein LOC104857206 n=1 Tax=Fukomys damarensis TaxID=885580 RepID=UPI001454E7D7|nr:uncharacterized protein LOC104857206 [Fukomys damarensis]